MSSERRNTVALGGGDGSDGLLIGPFMDWWDKRTAKRDAKRTRKLEANAAKRAKPEGPVTEGRASS